MPPLILVVDDSPDVLQVITATLRLRGYETATAEDGYQALQFLEQRRPDLIICDIRMPEMDGFEIFRRMRSDRRWHHIPFVFLTGITESSTRLHSTEIGAEAFLTKPVRSQELLAVVAGLLRRAQELQSYNEAELESFKSQLLFMFTHELNTPLSVIRMLLDNLRNNLPHLSQAQLADHLNLLARSTDDISYLIETMLLALQIDSGQAQTRYLAWSAPQPIRPLLDRVIAQSQSLAAERKVTIVVENGIDPCFVHGHEEFLHQIFARLLDNAICFSPAEETVTVRVMRVGDRLHIAFSDKGPGMTPEEVRTAFERMHQIRRDEQQQHGIGMSLNLVRSLARMHGGEIAVETAPGKGSTFTVILPCLSEPPH